MPPLLHQATVAVTLLIEIPLAFLLLAPSSTVRRIGAGAQVLLQVSIALTGNYTFFNLLAALLCLPVWEADTGGSGTSSGGFPLRQQNNKLGPAPSVNEDSSGTDRQKQGSQGPEGIGKRNHAVAATAAKSASADASALQDQGIRESPGIAQRGQQSTPSSGGTARTGKVLAAITCGGIIACACVMFNISMASDDTSAIINNTNVTTDSNSGHRNGPWWQRTSVQLVHGTDAYNAAVDAILPTVMAVVAVWLAYWIVQDVAQGESSSLSVQC